jgi:lincosamide and streptogramin A transport system ATP-binding/permease protein
MISVNNLTFGYDGSYTNIFENVSFNLDSNWKLGFIGRNGRGKTTFLNLLLGKYEYQGTIKSDLLFDYFPFEIKNKSENSYEIAKEIVPDFENWKLDYEISQLDMDLTILKRPFATLSKGEQTRILLGILFSKNNNFLLIDEPTNHLDFEAREIVADYLNSKKGFILVSHDRRFLDNCIDHVLSINKTNIEVQKGNFSSWWENKQKQDNFELTQNEKLKSDIARLEKSARQTANWSDQVEKSKYNIKEGIIPDKGYIGHKSAKMMKRSIVTKEHKERAIEEKSKLLKNIEIMEELKITTNNYRSNKLIEVSNLSIDYGNGKLFNDISFTVNKGDRISLKGKNGSGKSSLIKLILGQNINYSGNLYLPKDLKISYVSQDTSYLNGSLKEFVEYNKIDITLFMSILRKLDFSRKEFDRNIEFYSEGQKKKVLIAKSLCEKADLYIWDEPLNYIDIYSRIQIENLILNYHPTMIFVEHDETFANKIATDKIEIKRI